MYECGCTIDDWGMWNILVLFFSILHEIYQNNDQIMHLELSQKSALKLNKRLSDKFVH